MVVLIEYVLRQLICTRGQVGASCSNMTYDCELTVDYNMLVSLGKS